MDRSRAPWRGNRIDGPATLRLRDGGKPRVRDVRRQGSEVVALIPVHRTVVVENGAAREGMPLVERWTRHTWPARSVLDVVPDGPDRV